MSERNEAANIGAVPYEEYRAQRANEARIQAAKMGMDRTVPGGCYLVDGVWRDANGLACDAPKGAKDAEQAFATAEEERLYAARQAAAAGGFGPDANAEAERVVANAARLEAQREQVTAEQQRIERDAKAYAAETAKANRESAAQQADAERKAIAERKAKQDR